MDTAVFLLSAPLQGVDPNQFNDFLILGYVVMWIIGLAYVISLLSRQRNVQKDVELMERLLQEDEERREP